MKTILIGTDGSESADAALDFAVELCRDTGAALEVVTVQPSRLAGRGGAIPVLEIEDAAGARRIAQRAADVASAAGVEARAHGEHGDPAERLAARAAELDADLVIVGSRGLGSVGAVLLGSVSRGLVKRCEAPVTVVHSHHDREPAAV